VLCSFISCVLLAALAVSGACSTPRVRRCVSSPSTTFGYTSGAWISANSARVLNSLFDGNTAAPGAFTFDDPVDIPSCEWTAPMSSGGGLVVSGDDVMVDGCSFQNNIVFGNGGGASAHVDPAGTLSFVDCSFEGNIARYSSWYVVFFPNLPESGPQGGGLYLNSANDSAYLVDRCRFDNNLVGIAQDAMGAIDLSRGGAIRAELLDEQLTILNSQFCLNRGAQDSGLLTDVPTDVINCTFALNETPAQFAAVSGPVILLNTIVWGNNPTAFQVSSAVVATFSIIEGGWPGMGNLNQDPLFEDVSTCLLRPDPLLSPAIDAGDLASYPAGFPADLAGADRFSNCMIDIGAFEFQDPDACRPDINCDGELNVLDFAAFQ